MYSSESYSGCFDSILNEPLSSMTSDFDLCTISFVCNDLVRFSCHVVFVLFYTHTYSQPAVLYCTYSSFPLPTLFSSKAVSFCWATVLSCIFSFLIIAFNLLPGFALILLSPCCWFCMAICKRSFVLFLYAVGVKISSL